MEIDDDVIVRVRSLLESLRLPDSDEEIARWFAQASDAPDAAGDAESILDLIEQDPSRMMGIALEILASADEADLSNAGIVLLGPLLRERPLELAGEFEAMIRSSESFRKAFSRVSMTGVPLEIQRTINAAMIDSGADPRLVVEYDESGDEEF